MTPEILSKGFNISLAKAQEWCPAFEMAFSKYEINTPERQAGFLGQVAVESGCLQWTRELWGPTTQQKRYEREFASAWPPTPQDQTNKLAYELGNFEKGDGFLFRGGGLIETTGRTNYTSLTLALDHDFISAPEDIALPEFAVASAGHYWNEHDLNQLADAQNWRKITLRTNGGLTAYAKRLAFTETFLKLLSTT